MRLSHQIRTETQESLHLHPDRISNKIIPYLDIPFIGIQHWRFIGLGLGRLGNGSALRIIRLIFQGYVSSQYLVYGGGESIRIGSLNDTIEYSFLDKIEYWTLLLQS